MRFRDNVTKDLGFRPGSFLFFGAGETQWSGYFVL